MVKEGYKRTDVGIVPNEWNIETLQALCVPGGIVRGPFGGALKKEMFVKCGYKVYEQGNAINQSVDYGSYYIDSVKYSEMKRFAVTAGDFIISCSGTIGKIFKIPENSPDGIINQALLKLTTDKSKIDDNFFYYYFSWDHFNQSVIDDTQGGAMKNLVGMDIFRNVKFSIPDIPEQSQIARALSDIDKLIDDLEKLIKKKKNILQGAIQELLTGHKRLPGFDDEWIEMSLSDISSSMIDGPFGSDLKTEHYTSEHEVRLIQLSNIGEEGWNNENVKYTTFEHAKELARCKVKPGDVVIAKMMPAGRTIICPTMEQEYILASDVVKFVPNERIIPEYFVYATKSEHFMKQIADNTQGSTRARTSISKLRKIMIMVPKIEEQKAISELLCDMSDEIRMLDEKLEKTKLMKQGMMQKLLTGEIRLV